jgi:ubiquinone/menaquinone biosynthesis C-methylase UbiE
VRREFEKHCEYGKHWTTRFLHHQRIVYLGRIFLQQRAKNNGMALDIGCGGGIYTMLCASQALTTIGIDISKIAIKESKTWASSEGLFEHTDFVVCSAELLPFKAECFDLVLFSEVIEHIDNPRAGIREIARVVKEAGRVVLTVPNLPSYYWTRRRIGYDLLRLIKKRKRNEETERHTSFPFWRTNSLLKEANLAILSEESTNILPVPFSLLGNPSIYQSFTNLSEQLDNLLRHTPLKVLGSSLVVIARKNLSQ